MGLYQPLQQLSVDERIVKSNADALSPVQKEQANEGGDFKYWVVSDPTGYTLDFNICLGARTGSGRGVAYDAVMQLVSYFASKATNYITTICIQVLACL